MRADVVLEGAVSGEVGFARCGEERVARADFFVDVRNFGGEVGGIGDEGFEDGSGIFLRSGHGGGGGVGRGPGGGDGRLLRELWRAQTWVKL